MIRSLGHWVAFVLSLVAVLAAAAAVQAFAELWSTRVDLTARGDLSLSDSTLALLRDVKDPLQITYYYEGGKLRRVFPVVFGKPSTPTPVGRFAVYSKTAGPSAAFGPLVLWYHRGYGIHGTNQEYLLAQSWRYYSHGCTRNYNANIMWLWPRVPVGTPVINLA